MNIIIKELKSYRKSLIVWSIGIILMIVGGMGKYAAYKATDQKINDIIAQMPKNIRELLGFGSYDLTTASGFYGVLFYYLILMATIHAIMLGANIICKEERDKTSEFLLVKPLNRGKIVLYKIISGLFSIVIFNLVTLAGSIAMIKYYSENSDEVVMVALMVVSMLFLQLMFFFIGTAIAAISKNPKRTGSIATGILLATFMLSKVVDISSNLNKLKYFTPFKYFDVERILNGKGLDGLFIILSSVIVLIMIYITFNSYSKRDMTI